MEVPLPVVEGLPSGVTLLPSPPPVTISKAAGAGGSVLVGAKPTQVNSWVWKNVLQQLYSSGRTPNLTTGGTMLNYCLWTCAMGYTLAKQVLHTCYICATDVFFTVVVSFFTQWCPLLNAILKVCHRNEPQYIFLAALAVLCLPSWVKKTKHKN